MDQETADILKRMAELLREALHGAYGPLPKGVEFTEMKALQKDIAELGAPAVVGITRGTTGADMSVQPAGGDDAQ